MHRHLEVEGLRDARIIDLAPGTGKFTEGLAGRDEDYDILAVDPRDGMRGRLERKNLSGVQVLGDQADSMPETESQSVDRWLNDNSRSFGPLDLYLGKATKARFSSRCLGQT